MDEMTQHNAALVEETNAAIEQTKAQAAELDGIVDVFKLDAVIVEAPPARQIRTPAPAWPKIKAAVGQDWNEF